MYDKIHVTSKRRGVHMEINKILKDTAIMTGPFPELDKTLDVNPLDRFAAWYVHALENGTAEPSSMVLGTVDEDNNPDSRVVLLKAMDNNGFYFETGKAREKVKQLAHHSSVSLNFYWKEAGRQIRIKGTAEAAEDIAHVSDNLDAAVRDLNAYKIVPSEIEFYQALNEGGYARLFYKSINGTWKCDWL